MQKKRLVIGWFLLVLALLLSGCDRSPSHQVVEQAWQLEVAEPHLEEMAKLLGLRQARELITSPFEIERITPLGGGVYGVDFQSGQELMRPLGELAPGTSANAMRIVRSMFPSGQTGETARTRGYLKLKQTGAGWIIVDRDDGL